MAPSPRPAPCWAPSACSSRWASCWQPELLMPLASTEVIPFALPFREPYVTARGRLERREMALLRIRDDEGRVGLGEAVPLGLRGGAGVDQVSAELEQLAGSGALERALESGRVGDAAWLPEDLELSPPARCAALTALLDL